MTDALVLTKRLQHSNGTLGRALLVMSVSVFMCLRSNVCRRHSPGRKNEAVGSQFGTEIDW